MSEKDTGSLSDKPEVTNPSNLAPVNPHEPRQKREDIRAAIFETKLRRLALAGFVFAAVAYFVWQGIR
ncbi:long-chain fatty acid--CoA ligase [Rothia sp. P7181]|uniref:long-chain fatty acid--CoA ligase n=1 Tax=Rothia sp. P7181 TaxID=3402663 RepID=UPI003AE56017